MAPKVGFFSSAETLLEKIDGYFYLHSSLNKTGVYKWLQYPFIVFLL